MRRRSRPRLRSAAQRWALSHPVGPIARRSARLWSGAQPVAVELALPASRSGWAGWVVVPSLGAPGGLAPIIPALHASGLAVLTVQLLDPGHALGAAFDAPALGRRLAAAARWLLRQPEAIGQRLGFLAAGPAAAAALWASAELGRQSAAVVALDGRPDLALQRLPEINAPVLLVAGRADRLILDANRQAAQRLNDRSRLVLAPSFFYQRRRLRDPGALDALLAVEWLGQHVAGLDPARLPRPPITAKLPPLVTRGGAVAAATVAAVLAALAGPARQAEAAGSVDVTGGVLTYTGSGLSTALTVTLSDTGNYVFSDALEGSLSVTANATAAGCVAFLTAAACPNSAVNSLIINLNDGNDLVLINPRDGFDDTTINGGNGTDILAFDDSGNNFNDVNTLTASTFTRSFLGTFTYQTFEHLAITAEPGSNTINIQGTSIPTDFDGHNGNDTFVIGSSNSLDNIDGALTVSGGLGSDVVRMLDSASGNAMSFNGVSAVRGGMAGIVLGGGIEAVSLDSGSANDSLQPLSFVAGPVTLRGGGGNDTIAGGAGDFNDVLDGGSGTNQLNGFGDSLWDLDNNQLHSINHGTDALVVGTFQAASLTGTGGNDVMWADQFTQGPVTLVGGDGNDLLAGAAYAAAGDSLNGGNGADTFFGLHGNDTIAGGPGDDELREHFFGTGNATLTNSSLTTQNIGTDSISGIDRVWLRGGGGNDSLDASAYTMGPVTLEGEGGNDTLWGGGGNHDDTLHGGAGTDWVFGSGNTDWRLWNDRLDSAGLRGDDSLASIEFANLTGGGGNNIIEANAFSGSVVLNGAGGTDTLRGGLGNDTLTGGAGNDWIEGGPGTDRVVETADSDFNLINGALSGAGVDLLFSIEEAHLTGGAGNNVLDALFFNAGPVTLDGAGGNDTLFGGAGNDSLIGGAGTDQVTASRSGAGSSGFTLSDTALVVSGLGSDALSGVERALLVGSNDDDTLNAAAFTGNVTLQGNSGNDRLHPGGGNDSVDGGAGTDTLVVTGNVDMTLTATEFSATGFGLDTLAGIEAALLTGGAGDNTLNATGFTGSAVLVGQGGNDTLTGGLGNDTLNGGPGIDSALIQAGNDSITLSGSSFSGQGNDTFIEIEQFGIQGGPGSQTFDASAFDFGVLLDGAGGNDTLIGSNQADTLLGGAGNDLLIGNGGNDSVDGGANTDRVVADGDFALYTLTNSLLTADGTDTLANVEEALLLGGGGLNTFHTQAFTGLVYLDGGANDDTFVVSPNGGIITGGLGANDVISLTADLANLTLSDTALNAVNQYQISGIEAASLTGGAGANAISAAQFTGRTTLNGLGANDTLTGGQGPDRLFGGDGDDTLTGNQGADSLDGGAGTADRWVELADFNITLVAEGVPGEQIDTVTGIEFATITGKDSFDNNFNLTGFAGVATIDGGAGNDRITGGSLGDVVFGGAGDDTITGAAANDTLDGGAGTDRLFASGALTLTLSTVRLEGQGRDTLANIEEAHLIGTAADNLYDASAFGSVDTAVGKVTLEGLGGNDTLIGGVKADSLTGGQGNDLLIGNDGDDTLTGGDTAPGANTNDTLIGGGGNDLLDGVFGDDLLLGEGGNDTLIGASGHDTMDGGAGDDSLSAAFDDDTAVGTPGNDVLTGGPGNDLLEGGPGIDRVVETGNVNFTYEAGDPGTGTLHGGALGDDTLVLVEQASLTGGAGGNSFDLAAFPGPVTLVGLGGHDTFTGSAFNDSILGGDGTDRLVETADVNWTLSDSLAVGRGSDTLLSIEEASLTGGSSPNLMSAALFSGPVTLIGLGGNDTLVGGGGNDSLDGGDDDDILTGNLGDDSLIGGPGANGVTEVVTATTGVTLTLSNESLLGLGTDVLSNTFQVTLTGGPGPDLMRAVVYTGTPGVDLALVSAFTGTVTLHGAGGNDTLTGGLGDDSLDGGGGTDRLAEIYDFNLGLTDSAFTVSTTVELISTDALASIEQASLTGGASANQIDASGFSGVTTLIGLGGNDVLIGGSNNDSILGGAGSDTLTGGPGNDTLDGGADTDRLSETADVPLLNLTNLLLTGLGTDQIISIEQASLSGGPGNNTLNASAFNGPVTLSGGAGADTLIGGSGNDSLDGGEGPDTLTGGAGSDILFGGAGSFEDTLVETTNALSVILTTANLIAGGVTDFLNSLEVASLTGGAANQTLDASGFNGRARLDGAGGNDSLIGTLNADTLLGGPGNDTIRGHAGSDQLDGGDGELDRLIEITDANMALSAASLVITQGVTILSTDVLTSFEQASLTGGLGPNIIDASAFTGSVTLVGLAGHDRLIAGPLADSLLGGEGNDTLTGGPGDDTLLGGGDVDRVLEAGDADFNLTPSALTGLGVDSLNSVEEADLTGGPGANTLDTTQFPGPVTLSGLAGNDLLLSGPLADSLLGGDGDDTAIWAGGNDTYHGGADTDLLVVTADSDFVLTDSALSGPAALVLSGVELASLTGGASGNDFDLTGWSGSATVEAGGGLDALSVGGTGGPDDYAISASEVAFGAATVKFNDVETLSLFGGDGDDAFSLLSLAAAAADPALTAVNLYGGAGDDLFDLAPFPSVAVHADGGDHVTGDTLTFHAGGLYVQPDPGGLLIAEGRQPVSYVAIEFVNVLDRLYRLFLSMLGR